MEQHCINVIHMVFLLGRLIIVETAQPGDQRQFIGRNNCFNVHRRTLYLYKVLGTYKVADNGPMVKQHWDNA